MPVGTWPDAWDEGAVADRPSAGDVGAGSYYYATDEHKLYRSDGVSTWSTIDTFSAATHVHSGADITSGTVVDARIDSAIARDTELPTRTTLGLATGDTPQLAGLEVGHASDTTLSRASAGVLQVEGNRLFAVGGTDVPVADGGTGASTASAARTNLGVDVPGAPAGLTGAVAATRYVGGTASVAPTTGTFAVGDFVITQAGSIYICTVAGSPGTWVAVSGGGGGSALTVEEIDGSPTDSAVTSIKVPNGSLGISSHAATMEYLQRINGGRGTIQAHSTTGSTETFDLANGNLHTATLDANCTFTLSGFLTGTDCTMVLVLTQDGTGSRTVTWPGSVTPTPVLSTAAGAVDIIVLQSTDGGTTIYASDGYVVESELSLSDNTTGNATTGRHGFLKKLDNNSAHFMDGQGNWSTPGTATSVTFVGCRANNTAGTSINNNTETAVPFAAADSYDTSAIHDTSSNNTKLIVPSGKDGYWRFTANYGFAAGAGTRRYAYLLKNGTDIIAWTQDDKDTTSLSAHGNMTATVAMVATDYVELYVAQNSGGALALGTTAGENWLEGILVGV